MHKPFTDSPSALPPLLLRTVFVCLQLIPCTVHSLNSYQSVHFLFPRAFSRWKISEMKDRQDIARTPLWKKTLFGKITVHSCGRIRPVEEYAPVAEYAPEEKNDHVDDYAL